MGLKRLFAFPQNKFKYNKVGDEGVGLIIIVMRKKISRQKEIKMIRERRCTFCNGLGAGIGGLQPKQLRVRYYQPQIQTYFFRSISNLLYDPYSTEHIQLGQARRICQQSQQLRRYYTFSETVKAIKGVITRRVEKDFYGWVDFSQHFTITNVYYLRRKQLVQKGRQMEKYLKNASELQSTGSGDNKHVREYIREKIKKQLDQQRIVQPQDSNSILDIQRLARNIEVMVEKIADLSTIRSKRRVTQPRPVISFNSKEISAIQKVNQGVEVEFKQPKDYQQSYGLETIRTKQNKSKKSNKMGLRSMDRLNGLEEMRQPPETPSPRFLHRIDYGEQQQHRGSRMVPLSPNNHSSSSLQSKNGSRNKSKSTSRRK